MYTLLSPIHNGLTILVRELEEFIKQTAIDTVRPLLTNNVRQLFTVYSICLFASICPRFLSSFCPTLECDIVLGGMSVCRMSIDPSHTCIDSKRITIGSHCFHHQVYQGVWLVFRYHFSSLY